jgi:hypothetical protein
MILKDQLAAAIALSERVGAFSGRKPEDQDSARRGNSVTWTTDELAAIEADIFACDENDFSMSPVYRRRLLTVDKSDIEAKEVGAGSWVLSLYGSRPGSGALNAITPVVAEIDLGSGTIVQTFSIDAWRATLSLPADTVSVSVGFARQGFTAPVAGCPQNLPNNPVTITGHLGRSISTGASQPTRSGYLIDDDAATGSKNSPVPSKAVAFRLFWPDVVAAGDTPVTSVRILDATTVIEDIEPAVITSQMLRAGCWRKLPAPAFRVAVEWDTTVSPYCMISYLLGD